MGVQIWQVLFSVAAWIAVGCGTALGQSGGPASDSSDQAEQLRQRIAALESELAEARAQLESLERQTPEPAVSEPVAAEPPAATVPAGVPASPGLVEGAKPALPSWLTGWKSRIEVGFNGAEGNSTRQSLRLVFKSDRKTERHETHFGSLYKLTTQEAERSENRLVLDARNDWLQAGESPVRYFIKGTLEFDEFQAWDARASGFGGVGYEILKDEKTTLLGRGGFGGSKRFGGTNDEFRAEAFVSADLAHQLSDDQKLTAGVEYLPDTDGWREYRLNADASWEVRIDPESELYLRVGVATRYDSDPGRAESTDLDYFVNLGWTF